jgi:hypothetical protein
VADQGAPGALTAAVADQGAPGALTAAACAAALQAIDTGVAQLCRADQEELLLVRWARGVRRAEGRQQHGRLAAAASPAAVACEPH